MARLIQIHVSPTGDDSGQGTKLYPVRTIQSALNAAKARLSQQSGEVRICLAKGIYNLEETITVGPELSGLTLCGEEGQEPVLTGVCELKNWRPVSDSDLPVAPEARGRLWQADLPPEHCPQALYVNGLRHSRAMCPKHNRWEEWPLCAPGANRQELLIPQNLQRRHVNEQDIVLNFLSTPYTRWTNYIATITATQREHISISRPLTPNDYLSPSETIPFRIENALEALTEPGEWCADRADGHLYFWPGHDENPEKAHGSVPFLSCLIRLQGTEQHPVRDVHLVGLQMTQTGAEGAAVELSGTVECIVAGCTFQDLEGQAVQADGFTRGLCVTGCRVHRCGAAGISIHATQCSGRIISGHNLIEENEISHCGEVDWHAPGIMIRGSSYNGICGNYLHDLPYAAITVSGVRLIFALTQTVQNWPVEAVPLERIRERNLNIEAFKQYICGHNTIEKNKIHDVMMQLDDGGAIYCHASHHNRVCGNSISRTHRAASHGLYFDDDEVCSVMEDNRVVDAPLFPGNGSSIHVHDNARNTVQRNVVLNSYCPFTFPSSYGGHRVSGNTFVMKRGARMPTPPQRNHGRYAETKWDAGENHCDGNLYWSEDDGRTASRILEAMQEHGFDMTSRVGAPGLDAMLERNVIANKQAGGDA